MKWRNFRITGEAKDERGQVKFIYAEVDEVSWFKVVRRVIYRHYGRSRWSRLDNGDYYFDTEMTEMEDAFKARVAMYIEPNAEAAVKDASQAKGTES